MESQARHLRNKSTASIKTESKKQHQEAVMTSAMTGGHGSFQPKKRGKSINSPTQTKIPTSTVTAITSVPGSAAASTSTAIKCTVKLAAKQADTITPGTAPAPGSSGRKITSSTDEDPEDQSKHHSTCGISADSQESFHKTSPALIRTILPSSSPKSTSGAEAKRSSKESEASNDDGVMENTHEVLRVRPLGTKRSTDGMLQKNEGEERNRERNEAGKREECGDFTLQDRLQESPGATTVSASHVKETPGRTDETECEREKRQEWNEGVEGREALGGPEGNDKGKERNAQDGKKGEMDESVQGQTSELIAKGFRHSPTMTEKNLGPVQTLDAAQQTELLYEDAGVQAVVEVSDKSTTMSPNITRLFFNQTDLGGLENVANTSFQNGRSQDVVLDLGSSAESKDTSLTPDKSSKASRQHVCQIQIELCGHAKDPPLSSPSPGTKNQPKQDQAEAQLPEVAWDEQGMTWEVYGAAVDMESLGFAIQNHLQRKIQEHEQRIRHLRKSVSLSEHSGGEGKRGRKAKKKRKVFRCLFQRSACCLKA